jgi:hypothetical protein
MFRNLIKSLLYLTFIFLLQNNLAAQPVNYPKNYFRNPLNIPMDLQANFGELRPDHWHMGLDIRTAQKENQEVVAAADGYIASIGIRPASFGRFIIINHPNGLSTLYAHLNDFYPDLEQYVTDQQYKNETWAIELKFTKDQFPVSKGQFIAYSGNTGGSQGPHLHFEVFNTLSDERLNPLLLNLPVEDLIPPSFTRLALYDRSMSVYKQVPQVFVVKNTDSGYIIPKPTIIRTGSRKISFAIGAHDKMKSGGSEDGIYSATLFLDDQPQVAFIMDSISYEQTVYINSQIDYRYRSNGGAFLQHLSQMPGDHGKVYKTIANDGVIELNDTNQHVIRVEIKDALKNESELNFIIQHDDSISGSKQSLTNESRLVPNRPNNVIEQGFEMHLPPTSLYDTVQTLYYKNNSMGGNAISFTHQVNDATIPLHDYAMIKIKPDRSVPADWRDKIVIVRSSKGTTVKKAKWQGEWATASFNDFGSFTAYADLTGPGINSLGKGDTVNLSPASRIVFTPTDNFGIRSFRAELDSQWLRFTNDKGHNWIYKFDERCPYGVHHLKITVEDLVGNTTTKEWWFKRYPYTPPPKKKAVKKKSVKKSTSAKKKATVKKKK